MNIALLAIGKRGYHYAAYNLATSIKHFDRSAKVLLITDDNAKYLRDHLPFDSVVQINPDHIFDRGSFSPAMAKMHVDYYATKHFNRTPYLFIDADTIALHSIKPFFDGCKKHFETGIIGSGGRKDAIEYSVWAINETICKNFELPEKAKYYAPRSDWWYSDGSEETSAIFAKAIELFPKVTIADLAIKWGKCIPDELVLGAALALLEINASSTQPNPIFLGTVSKPMNEVKRDFYLLSIYGNGKGRTLTRLMYLEFYDRHVREIMKFSGRGHIYKQNQIMSDKWINK